MRAIGSIRVSTEDRAAEGVSLEAQQARLRAWCQANNASIDEGNPYTDAGLSGKRADNRPALQTALDAVCTARGVLVV